MKDVLTYKGFIGSVQYLSKEERFIGKVMNLDSEISFEGDSHSSLLASFHLAVDQYIDQIERQYTGTLNCPVEKQLHQKLVTEALASGVSFNQYIIQILENR